MSDSNALGRMASFAGMILLALGMNAWAEGTLQIGSPRGGEQWSVGSQHVLRWEGNPPTAGPLEASVSTDGGAQWTSIAASPVEVGKLLWTIPDRVSNQCRIRLSSGKHHVESPPFAITPSQQVPSYHWTCVTPQGPFAPRDGAGALTFQGKMWLLGGWNPRDKVHFPRICSNDVWSSADGANWTLEKPNTFLDASFDAKSDWEGRHTAGYVVFQDKMWILGGDPIQGHYQSDVWNSADGRTWTLVNRDQPVPWGPRALHYTAVFQDKIWVLGGQTAPQFAPAPEAFYRDVWNTSDGIHWNQVAPVEPFWPQRGQIGGHVVFNGRLWLLGGGTYDTPERPKRLFYNDVWSTADGVHWQQHTAEAPWAPRQYVDVAVFDGRMWVLEGWNQQNRNDVWYSADGVNWYEVPGTPWKPRHASSAFTHNNALWMVVGNNMESDVWKLQR